MKEMRSVLMGWRASFVTGCLLLGPLAFQSAAQTSLDQQQENSPIVAEASAQVGHVFDLPPTPGAPFTAVVDFETTQTLTDGTVVIHKSSSNVARDSKGRTRNELRAQNDSVSGLPSGILQIILYDPETHLRTTISPRTRTARRTLATSSNDPTSTRTTNTKRTSPGTSTANRRNAQTEEVGIDFMSSLEVKHFRERRLLPAGTAGNDRDIQTLYEYWYSPDLKVNLVSKRIDPRAGTQAATLKEIHRGEPDASLFEIPAGYKVIGTEKSSRTAH